MCGGGINVLFCFRIEERRTKEKIGERVGKKKLQNKMTREIRTRGEEMN